jgi:predicted phage terminase large subunit-like protein
LSAPRQWIQGRSFVEFRHLQHEADKYAHQGKQYAGLAFDEATHFEESQFWYMLTRNRKAPRGLDPFFVLTCNPDPDSWVKELISWWLDDKGDPILERSGKLRWFLRRNDELIWGDSPEELEPYFEDERDRPLSVTFIPAALDDNPALLAKDPDYRSRLRAQMAHDRAGLEKGNWNARPVKGDYFQRGWFRLMSSNKMTRRLSNQPDLDKDLIRVVRAWDLAGTPVDGDLVAGVPRPDDFKASKDKKKADWSRGIKAGLLRNGDMVVLDMVSCRDTPGAVRQLRHRTAIQDGPRVLVSVPQDPGQAGLDQVDREKADMRGMCRVIGQTRSKDKAFYARPVSVFCYSGRMWYMEGAWNSDFFNELENFPPDNKSEHDDIVDAFADTFRLLDRPGISYEIERVRSDDNSAQEDPVENDVRTNAGFRRGGLL